jgi:hypothetical protein
MIHLAGWHSGKAQDSYSGGFRFETWSGKPDILTEVSCTLSQSFKQMPASIVPRPLPSKSFPILYSTMIDPTVQLTVSLNKTREKE